MGPAGDIVLVVDDDADVRESLELVLRDAGYDVFLAEDGQAALDMLGFGLRPAVILLDLMMPRLNGLEFLEQFRTTVAVVGRIELAPSQVPAPVMSELLQAFRRWADDDDRETT